jgi:hypothetical protein
MVMGVEGVLFFSRSWISILECCCRWKQDEAVDKVNDK